jgi:hypothetical protein
MADTYIAKTLTEIAAYYQGVLLRSFYAFESRNQGREIIIIPYGGNASNFSQDQHYVFRAQVYCQDATHKDTYNLAWNFYELFKNNYTEITPTTYRIHYVNALDQPSPIFKNDKGIFWTTMNFEITLVLV